MAEASIEAGKGKVRVFYHYRPALRAD